MKGEGGSPLVEYAINNGNNWIPFARQATSSGFSTYRFKKPNGSIKNIKSIRLRISHGVNSDNVEGDQVMQNFELNDITIVYREKIL
jgi:hypothetical protein